MPIAYQWFSKHAKSEQEEMIIQVKLNSIHIIFSKQSTIKYDSSAGSTKVQWKEKNLKLKVKRKMTEVFCEDFREFLVNRKTILNSLTVSHTFNGEDHRNQVFKCMKSALKARSDRLQVKTIQFDLFGQKQFISLIQLLNPEDLAHICFTKTDIDEAIYFLSSWNERCRLNVIFKVDNPSIENLSPVKKILGYPSTFNQVQMFFEENNDWNKEKLISFLKPSKLHSSIFKRKCIEFNLSEDADLPELTDRLSLQDVRSLEVFANPLLMKKVLKGIDFFDIQCLRKVSGDIRYCIDSLKPDLYIKEYIIRQEKSDTDKCSNALSSKENLPLDTFIILENESKKCVRYRGRVSQGYEDDWHVDAFVSCDDHLIERVVSDFKTNTEHQKSIKKLSLTSNGNMLELIGDVLKSRDNPLGVKQLTMIINNESDIMNILPYIHSVESIEISCDSKGYLDLTEVLNLNQFTNVRCLKVMNSTNVVKCEDLHEFIIDYENLLIDDSLYTSMPPYYRQPNEYAIWYFPEESLRIVLNEEHDFIYFCCFP
uniref:FTH domain-containing protein n=1 Tax=Caenorhabditis tropicalis TaxID=1561998 RepID=A0A1I7U9P2_9PELO